MVQMPTSDDDNMAERVKKVAGAYKTYMGVNAEDELNYDNLEADAFSKGGVPSSGFPTPAPLAPPVPPVPDRVFAFMIKNTAPVDQEVILFDNIYHALLPGGIEIEGDYITLKEMLVYAQVKVSRIKIRVSDDKQLHNAIHFNEVSATGGKATYQIRPYSYASALAFDPKIVDMELGSGGAILLRSTHSISLRINAGVSIEVSIFADAIGTTTTTSTASVPTFPGKVTPTAPAFPTTKIFRNYKLTGRKVKLVSEDVFFSGTFGSPDDNPLMIGEVFDEIDADKEGLDAEAGVWLVGKSGAAQKITNGLGFEFTELTPETILITMLCTVFGDLKRLDDYEYMLKWIEKCGTEEGREGYDLEWWVGSFCRRFGMTTVTDKHKAKIRHLLMAWEVICLEESMSKPKKPRNL